MFLTEESALVGQRPSLKLVDQIIKRQNDLIDLHDELRTDPNYTMAFRHPEYGGWAEAQDRAYNCYKLLRSKGDPKLFTFDYAQYQQTIKDDVAVYTFDALAARYIELPAPSIMFLVGVTLIHAVQLDDGVMFTEFYRFPDGRLAEGVVIVVPYAKNKDAAEKGATWLTFAPLSVKNPSDLSQEDVLAASSASATLFGGLLALLYTEQTTITEKKQSYVTRQFRNRQTSTFNSYHHVEIKLSKHRVACGPPDDDTQRDVRNSPRWHFRRGYVRTYPSGKRGFVKHCMVGDPANGIVNKDYAVVA